MTTLALLPLRSAVLRSQPPRLVRYLYPKTAKSLRHDRNLKSNPKVEKEKQVKDVDALPLLQRPLGVREYPTIHIKTWAEKRNELMDQDVRLEHRRHLIKEATKGYFTDLNATRKYGGKTWIAPAVMIREDKALYFPNIAGKSLDVGEKKDTSVMCAGRISAISMLSTKISEYHAEGFVAPTNERYNSHPLYQYIQINLQENILKSFLVSLFTSSLRASVPSHLHSTYLVSSQNLEYVRESLGMVNNRVGYVFLVDENLKIRWGACADAKREETEALEVCTGVLLNRLDKRIQSSLNERPLPPSGIS